MDSIETRLANLTAEVIAANIVIRALLEYAVGTGPEGALRRIEVAEMIDKNAANPLDLLLDSTATDEDIEIQRLRDGRFYGS